MHVGVVTLRTIFGGASFAEPNFLAVFCVYKQPSFQRGKKTINLIIATMYFVCLGLYIFIVSQLLSVVAVHCIAKKKMTVKV